MSEYSVEVNMLIELLNDRGWTWWNVNDGINKTSPAFSTTSSPSSSSSSSSCFPSAAKDLPTPVVRRDLIYQLFNLCSSLHAIDASLSLAFAFDVHDVAVIVHCCQHN